VAWRTYVLEYEDGRWGLEFGITERALAAVWPDSWKFAGLSAHPRPADSSLWTWIGPLIGWFRGIAERAFVRVPYAGAVIGWEAGDVLTQFRTRGVPAERWHGYLLARDGALRWFPPDTLERACAGTLPRRTWRRKFEVDSVPLGTT
jgi:hypothetical protein